MVEMIKAEEISSKFVGQARPSAKYIYAIASKRDQGLPVIEGWYKSAKAADRDVRKYRTYNLPAPLMIEIAL